jgi:hypothetical protein
VFEIFNAKANLCTMMVLMGFHSYTVIAQCENFFLNIETLFTDQYQKLFLYSLCAIVNKNFI